MVTILVVEDDGDIAGFLSLCLTEAGYDVALVENGQQALEYLTHTRPALILSDFWMPIMNGFELCDRLAHDDHYQTIPLVLMSAGEQSPPQNEQHYAAFLSKPFLPAALLATLETAMQEGRN